VPSFPHLKEKELEYIVNNSDARAIITTAEASIELGDMRRKCKTLESIVTLGGTIAGSPLKI
jgi:long-subunit acyl-CoA synthetase (AMP-forming)